MNLKTELLKLEKCTKTNNILNEVFRPCINFLQAVCVIKQCFILELKFEDQNCKDLYLNIYHQTYTICKLERGPLSGRQNIHLRESCFLTHVALVKFVSSVKIV
ncbi:hypothetical protein SK128_020314 [Halocaridina rubra]|uniref:Uncharacterized protein n=1 Tax=Halocaridina rubra TaxID=373956 RepID=A0AAN9AE38_HALRR